MPINKAVYSGLEVIVVESPYRPGFGVRPAVLVGRDRILSRAAVQLTRVANSGHAAPSVTVFTGARGLGKTVTLDAIAQVRAGLDAGMSAVGEGDTGRAGSPDRMAQVAGPTGTAHTKDVTEFTGKSTPQLAPSASPSSTRDHRVRGERPVAVHHARFRGLRTTQTEIVPLDQPQ